MPATITPNDRLTEEKKRHDSTDHGSGRRPPIDLKHTGGGGDGDNWNDRPQGSRGPREKLQRYRLGLFFGLAGDLMFFVAIVSAFFVRKSYGHFDAYSHYINDWLPVQIPTILWLNTAVLLISSLTLEKARRGIFHEPDVMEEWLGMGHPAARRVLPWLSLTALLGCGFIAGQWIAWKQLAVQHVYLMHNPSSKFFFLITGIHGVHLLVGIIALFVALVGLKVIRTIESRQILIDCSAWYWHSMGLFWIFLFVLLEYFQ